MVFDRPSFVSECEQMRMRDFVYAINPEHGETSPESGDRLAVPDVVGDLLGSGGQIPGNSDSDGCHSVMCTLQPDPGGEYVSALSVRPVFARLMFIVALLQSVLSGCLCHR